MYVRAWKNGRFTLAEITDGNEHGIGSSSYFSLKTVGEIHDLIVALEEAVEFVTIDASSKRPERREAEPRPSPGTRVYRQTLRV